MGLLEERKEMAKEEDCLNVALLGERGMNFAGKGREGEMTQKKPKEIFLFSKERAESKIWPASS